MTIPKAVRLFPVLYNIKDFLQQDHPKHHPDSSQYMPYWETIERYCIEGKWGHDFKDGKGGWRYMPGFLYYYINCCIISDEDEDGNSTKKINPLLRDVEWYLSYAWIAARGFSGFEEDEEYTCHRLVEKVQLGIELTGKEEIQLRKKDEFLRKANGEYKTYIEARAYLHQTFDKPMGLPLYHNRALNLFVLGSRGFGKDLEENTLVYKEDGPVPIKDIQVGDFIYGRDGALTKVIDKANFYNQLQYQITFSDGRKIECGGGHLWTVFKAGKKEPVTLPLKEIYKSYLSTERDNVKGKKRDSKFFIPKNEPMAFPEKELPIDPYFLGQWLGDGSKHRVGVTTEDQETVDYLYQVANKWGVKVVINKNEVKTCPTYHLTSGVGGINHPRPLRDVFVKLNLLHNKHIPSIYLKGSIEQRIRLLKGLMDSDGYCASNSNCEYVTTDPNIKDGMKKKESGYFQSRAFASV